MKRLLISFPVLSRWRARRICTVTSIACALALVAAPWCHAAEWRVFDGRHGTLLSRAVSITADGQVVARLIYGPGEQKPFVAVYDENGRTVTNPGIDKDGNPMGIEPHHRGIFVGWRVIESDLGRLHPQSTGKAYTGAHADTWGMKNGSTQRLVDVQEMMADGDSASVVARIEWRAGTKDAADSNLLLTEIRRVRVSRPGGAAMAQIDHCSEFWPARDLRFGADVQHAGTHMRVDASVYGRMTETSYLWSPVNARKAGRGYGKGLPDATGAVVHENLQWGEFLFPLYDRWYSVVHMRSPANPAEEFSTREYGRFGYYFGRELRKGEPLTVRYRFLVKRADIPANPPKRSAAQLSAARREADAAYSEFVAVE